MMLIKFNDDQTRSLIQTLISEIDMIKGILEMEENYSKFLKDDLLVKDEEIKSLKEKLKASKPKTVKKKVAKKVAKPVVEAPVVKRGRGRPRKVVA
jgi:hypothetical protein